ncbi:MAG: tRNA (N6-threonylcarbamoyladenosine(37)-N6)-methyltransferase TrmO [Bacteroidota bacterium]
MKNLLFHPIGTIHTPYKDKYEAPRQPGGDDETVIGTIELLANKNFEQATDDLKGFEYIWILFWFNENADWKPKVLPPRGRTKRGVFATRSPHRPNPVGMSVCKLIDVNGRFIRIENPDMLDGTPILDIKPYLPDIEAIPDAKYGWIEEVEKEGIQFGVELSPLAQQQLNWFRREYDAEFIDQVLRILSFDPFPHPYRRIEEYKDGKFIIARKSWRIIFTVKDSTVVIERILSGYPIEALSSEKNIHDRDVHLHFHHRWMNSET